MHNETIAFIGAGNMATSLIAGLLATGYPPDKIWASNPDLAKLNVLKQRYQINIAEDNKFAAKQAQIILLCVKPQIIAKVTQELASVIRSKGRCVISIAAGIRTTDLTKWVGKNIPIIRCMPNTPAMVQAGATGIFANELVSAMQKEAAESILRAVGVVVWLEKEEQLDVVTALSGSGPAYFFLLMESLEQAAMNLGLDQKVAHLLTLQTALGAARLALESNDEIKMLREGVTSKGGTTEAALNEFAKAEFNKIVCSAVTAAAKRSEELSQQTK